MILKLNVVPFSAKDLTGCDRVVKTAYRTGVVHTFRKSKHWINSKIHEVHFKSANVMVRQALLNIK